MTTVSNIMQNARRELFHYAMFRLESAVIAAIAIVMTGLSLLDIFLPRDLWWVWLTFGIAGVLALVASTVRDPKALSRIAARLFYETFNFKTLKLPELQHKAATALEFHKSIFDEILSRKSNDMPQIVGDMDEWVANFFRVARGLDTVIASPGIVFANIAGKNFADNNPNSRTQPDTVQAFLDAMMISAQQAATQTEGLQRLSAVGNTMLAANAQLDQSINNVGRIRFHLTQAAPNPQFDREFAEQAHTMMGDQLYRLDQTGSEIESMYRSLAIPIQRQNS